MLTGRPIAAVLGGARGGFDELATLRMKANVVAVFACNDAAAEYPQEIDAFVTLHPEHLSKWLGARQLARLPKPREVVAHEEHPLVSRAVDYRWPGMNASGSSGLFCVKVALERFDRVVLCGVPMDGGRTHYSNSTFQSDVGAFLDAWRIALPHLKHVRSMSGWTADLLGRPDPEFLHPAGGTPVLNSEML